MSTRVLIGAIAVLAVLFLPVTYLMVVLVLAAPFAVWFAFRARWSSSLTAMRRQPDDLRRADDGFGDDHGGPGFTDIGRVDV
jgi:chromate transport protein ChrA